MEFGFKYAFSMYRKMREPMKSLTDTANGNRIISNVQTDAHVYERPNQLEMWANAQRDGRPVEYRWRPLFNAAKFG